MAMGKEDNTTTTTLGISKITSVPAHHRNDDSKVESTSTWCCCMSDRTGSITIAIFKIFTAIIFLMVLVNIFHPESIHTQESQNRFTICIYGIDLLFSVILLCGAIKRSCGLMALWICYTFVVLMLGIIVLVVMVYTLVSNPSYSYSFSPFLLLFTYSIGILLHCYFWNVVHDYWSQLSDEERQKDDLDELPRQDHV